MHLHKRVDLPPLPDCGNVCFTNQLIIDSERQGGCGFTDNICHCSSVSYMQPTYDCFTASCSKADSIASYNFVDAMCASLGAPIVHELYAQDSRLTSSVTSATSLGTSPVPPSSTSSTPSQDTSSTPLPGASSKPPSSNTLDIIESTAPSATSARLLASLSDVPSPTHSFVSTSIGSTSAAPSSSQTTSPTSSPTSNTGAIAGGSVAGVILLAIFIFSIWLYRRTKQLQGRTTLIMLTDPFPYEDLAAEKGHTLRYLTKPPRIITPDSKKPHRIPERVTGSSGDVKGRLQRPTSIVLTVTMDFPPPAYQSPLPPIVG